MKISIANDHGGFELKKIIRDHLKELGYQVIDCGCESSDSCDYPDFAHQAAQLVENGTCERGIVICTTGEGVAICANKHPGVRCGLAYNSEVCQLMRQHNNVNMISIGAKYTNQAQALEYVTLFLKTPFEGGRHERRVNKIEKLKLKERF